MRAEPRDVVIPDHANKIATFAPGLAPSLQLAANDNAGAAPDLASWPLEAPTRLGEFAGGSAPFAPHRPEPIASAEELRELVLSQHHQLDLLRREVGDLNLLIEALRGLLDLDRDAEPFTGVFAVLAPLFQFSHAVVLVDDGPAAPQLRCAVSSPTDLAESLWNRDSMLGKALGGRVIATVERAPDAVWPPAAARAGLMPEQPALYLPLGFRDQRGVLMLLRPTDSIGFDRRDVTVARRLSLLASQAFATRQANRAERERRRLRRRTEELRAARDSLAYRANHDELTGLVNRTAFAEQVRQAIRRTGAGEKIGLMFIDLDGFKQVNDSYGHEVGDQLLVAVANRLAEHAAGRDVLARVSGDEFIALVDPVGDIGGLARRIDGALAAVREPIVLGLRQVMVSASVGVAIYPDHGENYEQLRRHADMAMYSAKSAARGGAVFFDPRIGAEAADRLDREQDLRHAVAERRFRAVVQPKVDLRTMGVVGFEVLARQADGAGRLGPSAEFVELAAHIGLLDEITDIVVDDALAALPLLDETFGAAATISINVSTKQVTDPAKLAALLDRLRATGAAERFVIEVTEDALLAEDVFRSEVMPLLARARVGVSIDDFGNGYASLSRLMTVGANEIKIDRSFITRIDELSRSQVVVRALDTINQELRATVVAEGVETIGELDYLLARTRVDVGQGYLFCRPMPPVDLVDGLPALSDRLDGFAARAAEHLRLR